MNDVSFLFLLAASLSGKAQALLGYWYGNGHVLHSSTAKDCPLERILDQNKTAVHAILNYYYRNTFRSIQVNGNYNAQTRELILRNIPVTYFGSSGNMMVDCQMDFVATHRVAKAGSNLNGNFVGREGYRYTCP